MASKPWRGMNGFNGVTPGDGMFCLDGVPTESVASAVECDPAVQSCEQAFTASPDLYKKFSLGVGPLRGGAPQVVTLSESEIRDKEQASILSGSFSIGGLSIPKWAVFGLAGAAVFVFTRKKRR